MKVQLFVILLLAVCSCKSPEEKLAGKWEIESYTYHGADSMAQVNRLHQNDIITLTESMPDPMGSWGMRTTHNDTVYGFGGKWQLYEKNRLHFYVVGVLVTSRNDIIIAWNSYSNPATSIPIPFLLRRAWNINKQGKNSLKLSAVDDDNIKLELKRQ